MLEETATVVAVSDGQLTLETAARSACSQCGGGQCSTSVIAQLFGVRRNQLQLPNELNARPGEQVVIGIPDRLLVRASLTAYLLPLLAMIGLPLLGATLEWPQDAQPLLALLGLGGGFYLARRLSSRRANQAEWQPRLLRLVKPAGEVRLPFPNISSTPLAPAAAKE